MNFFLLYFITWILTIGISLYLNFKYKWYTKADFNEADMTHEPIMIFFIVLIWPMALSVILTMILPKIIYKLLPD